MNFSHFNFPFSMSALGLSLEPQYPNWKLLGKFLEFSKFHLWTLSTSSFCFLYVLIYLFIYLSIYLFIYLFIFEKPSDLYCLSCHMLDTSRSESCSSTLVYCCRSQVPSNKWFLQRVTREIYNKERVISAVSSEWIL